ncbi:hypothetical protein TTHERM_00348960 (macronuclear) [Tetrahymena thermophila SB210]|uniref:Uncharacterized protein n=1 Tax=Tetrahymena thermophila (strain SB210) TaxID=312017 RepID=I7MHB7_TETTS|nr:hypothetical protein TTHERM_00348960 [Tetrahymena thermophila SB210]EAS02806.1 hypothetical protein TTHERM_00348960 [Tetrahymena thermophila SB210]|eukprot:XP_001023051.1 hypothetical protein TTHERM_00348960 [Tetrahymena thermophila SB210]
MAFKNNLKQNSYSWLDKKIKDLSGTSFSTLDSQGSSRFPSPSLRHIGSFSDVDKQKTPQDNGQKSLQSFSDFMQNFQQEKEDNCHEISELNNESYSDDSDEEEHCIWDNSDAQEFGIDTKNFLNQDGDPFTFYQLYSIRSQLYQRNRVLRSTTIQEVSNISKFYEKPIKLTEMMNQQTYLDNTCKLFQQLPSLSQNQTPTNKLAETPKQQLQNEDFDQSFVQSFEQKEENQNMICQTRKQIQVKTIDIQMLTTPIQTSQKSQQNLLTKGAKQINSISHTKLVSLNMSVTPKSSVPVKTFSITDLLTQDNSSSHKSLNYVSSLSNLELNISESNSLTNIPNSTFLNKQNQVLPKGGLTPSKNKIINLQYKIMNNDRSQSTERKYLQKQSSKPQLPLSATRNISAKKNSFQSPQQSQKSLQYICKQSNKSQNTLLGNSQEYLLHLSPKTQQITKRACLKL